ncbi:MAG: hypothetical protein DRR04_06295 [Gammaproteobacteria bacterium]|nr:MAG: hypothetical protein DRR04_06295 [Gammaproteobacteria bacterium]
MPILKALLITSLLSLFAQQNAWAQTVIEDDGVGLSYAELKYIVGQWTPQMQKVAADDLGDRLELLNLTLVNKKMAREAKKISRESDPEAYWRYKLMIRGAQRKFVIDQFAQTLVVPDMSALAEERYDTEKEKYALIRERRISSHILFSCPPGQCSRADTKVTGQKVLDELRAGADFVEMVQLHSGDAGTRAKDGKFDKWMFLGEPKVSPPYTGGVFEIDEIGGYSELVSTEFGVHIIRLDGIEEAHFLPYAEVKDKIISDLEVEYRKLSIKNFTTGFNITDDATIDAEAMEKIFSKYKAPK